MADQAAPGWYADPRDPGQRRYWDGSKWTEHTQPQPAAQPTAMRPTAAPQPAQAAQPGPQAPPAAAPQAPAQGVPPGASPQAAPPGGPQAPPAGPAPSAPRPEGPPGGYVAPLPPGGMRQAWTGAPLSGWWSRVGAQIIDSILALLVFWIGLGLLLGKQTGIGLVLMLLGLIVAFLYYPLTMMREGERNGQSIGKQALGIRVSRDDGQPVDFGFAVLREFVVWYLLFQVVGGFFLYIPWLLDVLWPLWDDNNEALHDKIVKTHVVRA
jgi:uncharacterized RDD family membrane protein YckC